MGCEGRRASSCPPSLTADTADPALGVEKEGEEEIDI